MAFTVNVKRYSTAGGMVSAKAVIGKYNSGNYDVSITGSNDLYNITYTSGQYAIEIYNPSGYTFSKIDSNLPGLTFGDTLTNGRYYLFLPKNSGSYYVNVYYKPTITYYSVRVRSTHADGSGKFGEYKTNSYDTYWSGKDWSKSVSMPAGKTVAVEVKGVKGHTISSVDYCGYGGEIAGGKYFLKYGLNSNLDIVVNYTANVYTVSLGVSPSGGGSVSGGGDYSYGSTANISASPSAGYKFVKWSDGDTHASRSITITSDVSLTAEFEYIYVEMRITSGQGGTATIKNLRTGQTGSTVKGMVGDQFVFIGVPHKGYHKWYVNLNGSENQIPYDVSYRVDKTGTYEYTGHFAPNDYTIKVEIESGEYNDYYSGGTYAYGTALQMWVQINPHYVFHYWEDQNGNRIYPESIGGNGYIGKITVLGDTTYKLVASPHVYTITVSANPDEGGTVSGGGEYTYKKDVVLSATANSGYRFDHWSDGSKDNPHTITSQADKEYIAYFYVNTFKVMTSASPEDGGSVSGGGVYNNGTVATIEAIPNEGYNFVGWDDGSTNPKRKITVYNDIYVVAYFELKEFSVATNVYPDHAGSVDGGDIYIYGERARLTAYPIELHEFLRWDDGSQSNPYKFNVYEDVFLTAIMGRDPNVYVGDIRVKEIRLGDTPLNKVCLGETKVYLY